MNDNMGQCLTHSGTVYTDDAQLTILDIAAVHMKARQACSDDSAQVCTRRPKEVRNGHSAYSVRPIQESNHRPLNLRYVQVAAALADKPRTPAFACTLSIRPSAHLLFLSRSVTW